MIKRMRGLRVMEKIGSVHSEVYLTETGMFERRVWSGGVIEWWRLKRETSYSYSVQLPNKERKILESKHKDLVKNTIARLENESSLS